MRQFFSLKDLLLPLLLRPRIAMFVKWSVYSILVFNFVLYVIDDIGAYRSSLAADAALSDVLETFSTTIDTIAWLGLVFLLELETYILSDDVLESWLGKFLTILRYVCFASIAYGAYGYTAEALDNYKTVPRADLSHLCDLAGTDVYLQTDSIEYSLITADNCDDISVGPPFYKIDTKVSVIDAPTLDKVQKIEWVNVVNAFVWLLVVFLIEVEIRLQWNDRFDSKWLSVVQQVKTVSYGVLWVCSAVWLFKGYTLYGLDGIVWIAGFWAIELNLAEWEKTRTEELRQGLS
ncbi:MAG: hypothetical protein AB8B86_00045 [Pseudomonadales bacterium]